MKLYNIALIKKYFDTGYGITSILKWIIGVVGIGKIMGGTSLYVVVFSFFCYGLFCIAFGWFWYKVGMAIAEQEVNNQYDLLAKQLRKRLKMAGFRNTKNL